MDLGSNLKLAANRHSRPSRIVARWLLGTLFLLASAYMLYGAFAAAHFAGFTAVPNENYLRSFRLLLGASALSLAGAIAAFWFLRPPACERTAP